jgi:hypothetical protein
MEKYKLDLVELRDSIHNIPTPWTTTSLGQL